jgi:hypothetical protein
MPADFVQTTFVQRDGHWTKPKQLIISQDGETSGNSSCTPNHIVVTTRNWGEFPARRTVMMYNRCRPTQLIQVLGPKVGGSRLFDSQPIGNAAPSEGRQCWEGNFQACWSYPSDAWVTYQVGLDIGPDSYIEAQSGREVWDTRVRLWAQTDGQPTELVIDTIHPYSRAELGLGRVWFLPFMTGKDPEQVHPPTYTDYDELVVAKQRIPDVG